MKIYFFILNLILIIFPILGCNSLLVVESVPPQVEVWLIDPMNGERKSIGTTPLQMPMQEFKSKVGRDLKAGEYCKLSFEKKGFKTDTLALPMGRFGTLMTRLDVVLPEDNKQEETKRAKSLIDRLFLAQRLALLKEYERAHIELDRILVDYPDFVRAMTLRASIYLAQNKTEESQKWYEAALKIDPQMEDVIRVLAKIKGPKSSPTSKPLNRKQP